MGTMAGSSEFLSWGNREKQQGSRFGKRGLLLLAGAATAGYGLWRRDWPGGMAAAAGALLAGGVALGGASQGSCGVSQTIQRPAEEVYGFWRDPGNWPRFMPRMQSARDIGSRRILWRVESGGRRREGEAEILEDAPGRRLRWRLGGLDMPLEASLDLRAAPGERGTEVRLRLDWQNPRGPARLLKTALGSGVEPFAREIVRRMKQLLEAGEIPTTDGQPHGARGLKGKAERALFRENVREDRPAGRPATAGNQELAAS